MIYSQLVRSKGDTLELRLAPEGVWAVLWDWTLKPMKSDTIPWKIVSALS